LNRWLTKARPAPRPIRAQFDHFRPSVEALAERVMPAVTAVFSDVAGQLKVIGDGLDNTFEISRDAAGVLLVNNGAVAIQGGQPTVANTLSIMITGAGGNDNLSVNESNGAMPPASIFGGDGNDVLVGGSGIDFIDGGAGNDTIFLGDGDDTFQWNPGDGSDVVEGQGGRDTMVFNGSDVAEKFDVSANGARVRFTRDVGGITMDAGGVEEIDLNALGGADTITVSDQSTTGLNTFNLDLNSSAGPGDNQADVVIINGSNGPDFGQISSIGTSINATVSALPFVNITGTDGLDALTVNTLGGNDVLDASGLLATNASQLIKLTLNGGAGNDTLTGSQGFDTFVWNPGDGSDTIEGGAGENAMVFNGSDVAETFKVSANGNRVRLSRDVGGVIMDLGGVEEIVVNSLGGADTVTVNDLTGTPVTQLRLNLSGIAGGGDSSTDAVIVHGTNRADVIPIVGGNGLVAVDGGFADGSGLPYFTVLTGVEATDALQVNGNGGDDTIDASTLPALVRFTADGGAGNDRIDGGAGNDLVIGGPGDDRAFLGVGDDTFVWNPGDGNDTIEGMAGRDAMIFNGNVAAESFNFSANGERVRFLRDVDDVAMDLNDVERVDVNALGGIDAITINSLIGTDLTEINLNLAGAPSGAAGDAQDDLVIINGASSGELIPILGTAGGILVNGDFAVANGLHAFVTIKAVEPTDTLEINGSGGDDDIDASGLMTPVNFIANGDAGNDTLSGSPGDDFLSGGGDNDTIKGGAGNDVVFLGGGDDFFQWDSGDDSDTVDGQDGVDTLIFYGSNDNETFVVSANGTRAQVSRNINGGTVDLGGVEEIDVNAFGGADTITVNDLTGITPTRINLNLAGVIGGPAGDGQADTIIASGSNRDDFISVTGINGANSGLVFVVIGDGSPGALPYLLMIRGTEAAFDTLTVNTLGGNDTVDASGVPVGSIGLTVTGGDGNDTLTGSGDNDRIVGGAGNDVVFLGDGDDVFQWDSGDGSDTVDGQDGVDTMIFNGSNDNENIAVSANGSHVLLTRDVGTVAMDIDGIEQASVAPFGGADNIVVNDLTGTDLTHIKVKQFAHDQPHNVTVNGTNGADAILVDGDFANGVTVSGLAALVEVLGAIGATDFLTINALGGADTVDASTLQADAIKFAVNGGAGDDRLSGGQGADLVSGGPGADTALLGAGDDVFQWNVGDGSDLLEGQDGNDKLTFNGSDGADNAAISRNGSRVRLVRDQGNVAMDVNGFEGIELNALAGADTLTVNDLTGTGLVKVQLNLNGSAGTGNDPGDNVIVNATNDDDDVRLTAFGNTILVDGLFPAVRISGAAGTNDHLTVNALGGNDTVDTSIFPVNAIGLTVNLGDGQDPVATAPHVVRVTPNGNLAGLAGPQRSRVVSLVVDFDRAVQLDVNAVTLALHTKGVSFGGALQPNGIGAVPSALHLVTVDNIRWTLTFAGNTDDGADGLRSLRDGVYDLTVDAAKVHPLGAQDISMAASSTTTIHRLYGDIDAPTPPAGGAPDVDFQAIVNTGDNFAFRDAFNNGANYNAFLDFDGDGVINTGDNFQFRGRFNKALTWSV
jgi:Ca2+-binding RTX toxin-like protein